MRRRPILPLEEELPDEPLVNLTPLIDVVFVVLISFMLIAPILDIDSIRLAPSGPTSKKESVQNSLLAISIHADDSLWFQGQRMSFSDLEKHLLFEKKRRPTETPQVIPDARSHFETYSKVKNLLETCGFEQMDIVLRPQ